MYTFRVDFSCYPPDLLIPFIKWIQISDLWLLVSNF